MPWLSQQGAAVQYGLVAFGLHLGSITPSHNIDEHVVSKHQRRLYRPLASYLRLLE